MPGEDLLLLSSVVRVSHLVPGGRGGETERARETERETDDDERK